MSDREHGRETDQEYLNRMLSIGQGQCGTVFSFRRSSEVVKLPNSAVKIEELRRDAEVHSLVEKAFQQAAPELRAYISIPRFYSWITPASRPWWDLRAHRFPDGRREPGYALVSERIRPLVRPVREAIINTFCPPNLRKQAIEDPENRDCLVRLYLGRRADGQRSDRSFRLRNFPLYVNDMEKLRLNTGRFATIMADALAIMHWSANVDGNDVEFVLGYPPPSRDMFSLKGKSADPGEVVDHTRGAAENSEGQSQVWLLDFNQCSRFDPAADSAEWLPLLTRAFWFNDPYYPRPVSTNPANVPLWRAFYKRYRESSYRLTQSEGPALFIEALEEEGSKRRKQISTAGQNSLFGALAG